MAEKNYFVVRPTEDGEVYFDAYTEEELERSLNRDDFGENPNFLPPDEPIPDLDSWVGHIIIKGKVVVPKTPRWTVRDD